MTVQVPAAHDPWLTASRFPHLKSLDGLRAVAIGMVFLGHAGLGRIIIPGGLGVTLFFFLSGYLITSLLRAEQGTVGTISISGFYIRRVLRIVPPLWISLLLLGLASAAGLVPAGLDPLAIAAQALFAINYADLWGHSDGVPGMPLWSLAVEEHYYLIFPAVYLLLARHCPVRTMAAIFAAACGVALALRCVHVFVFHDIFYTYFFTHTRFDSILFGAILALWNNPALEERAWRPKAWQAGLALVLIVATVIPRNDLFRETIRYTLQGGLLFVLFSYLVVARGTVSRILTSWPMQIIGRYSYTIYLCHYFFLMAVHQLLPGANKVIVAVIGGLITLFYAAAMYRLVERNATRLRRRLHPVETPSDRTVDQPETIVPATAADAVSRPA